MPMLYDGPRWKFFGLFEIGFVWRDRINDRLVVSDRFGPPDERESDKEFKYLNSVRRIHAIRTK